MNLSSRFAPARVIITQRFSPTKRERIPTLIMNSIDDPFLDKETFPSQKEVPEMVKLEYLKKGGHKVTDSFE